MKVAVVMADPVARLLSIHYIWPVNSDAQHE